MPRTPTLETGHLLVTLIELPPCIDDTFPLKYDVLHGHEEYVDMVRVFSYFAISPPTRPAYLARPE